MASQAAGVPIYEGSDPSEGNHVVRFVLLVEDLDKEVGFFTDVLGFRLLAIREFSGLDLEALYGVAQIKIRVALLELGDQKVSLAKYVDSPGAPYPAESRSNDLWFQHLALVVTDMKKAHERLMQAGVQGISPGPITIPKENPAAAGISAFYFRDPEGHPLELIWFPPDKGLPVWQQPTDKLFIGIDHSAIAVADTARSLHFYGDLLGLEKKGESLNSGPTQEQLSGVKGAKVQITGLRHNHPTSPGIEFLHYLEPNDGKPIPVERSTSDRAFAHPMIFCTDLPAQVEKLKAAGVQFVSPGVVKLQENPGMFGAGCVVRDPDGHDVLLVGS